LSTTPTEKAAAGAATLHLFILDLNVPRIHGLELLRVIRAHPATANTPVAIPTSSQASSDKANAERAGANV